MDEHFLYAVKCEVLDNKIYVCDGTLTLHYSLNDCLGGGNVMDNGLQLLV